MRDLLRAWAAASGPAEKERSGGGGVSKQDTERMLLVSPQRANQINAFAQELVALCDRYRIDLDANEEMSHTICVIDRTREPDNDWPYIGFFNGVDQHGVWRIGDADGTASGIKLAERSDD